MYSISVIIPTLNRPSDLKNCLDSLVKQTLPPQEVLIIDQSSDDQTKNLVDRYREQYSKIIPALIYFHQKEKSSARARNCGIGLSTCDIVSFTDDDIILSPDYLEKILKYFEDPKIGGVQGNVLNPVVMTGFKSGLRKLLTRFFLLNNYDGKMTLSGFGYPIYERQIDKVLEVELFSGYSMNFRRELILTEQFDDWFEGYSFREDVDLSYRISQRAKLIMVPEACFYHNHSSVNRLDVFNLKRMQFKNIHYLFKKHRPQTLFYRSLFYYSMFGILFIDFIELVLNFTKQKKDAFHADLAGIFALGKAK